MELDLDLTPTTHPPFSPGQPAQKRSKEPDEHTPEGEKVITAMNELKWVIHTLTVDIEKRTDRCPSAR